MRLTVREFLTGVLPYILCTGLVYLLHLAMQQSSLTGYALLIISFVAGSLLGVVTGWLATQTGKPLTRFARIAFLFGGFILLLMFLWVIHSIVLRMARFGITDFRMLSGMFAMQAFFMLQCWSMVWWERTRPQPAQEIQ